MTIERYARAQREITRQGVVDVLRIAAQFSNPLLRGGLWLLLLNLLFPPIERDRKASAELAREFYDEQRQLHLPNQPRLDIFLPEYRIEWFAEEMEAVREEFEKPGASDSTVDQVGLRAAKVIEQAGRDTIIRGVEDEPSAGRVKWARVATGRETCGFCMMLVSRGPVFETKASAGDGRKFHPGCDCKVVPVFDKNDWPGRDAFLRAQELWKQETRGYRGQDALNAFRRAVENGDLDVREMSINV